MNPTNPQPTPQNPHPSEVPQPQVPPAQPGPIASPAPVDPVSVPATASPMQASPVEMPGTTSEPMAVTPPSDPAPVVGTVVMGGGDNPQPTPSATPKAKKPWTRKRLLLLVALPLCLVVLLAAGVFGLYLPNTPNSVWNTGLNRTGTAVDKLTTAATETEQLDKLTSSELSGSIDASWEGGKFSGEITASFDEEDSNSGLQVSITDEAGSKQEMSAKLLTQLKDEAKYPDIYFQLSGFGALGLDAFVPGISEYDGKWVVAESAYIESMINSLGVKEEELEQEDVTSADIAELTNAITAVTNEYVFTADADKAVLVKKSFVGKEELNGGQSYRYKANVDNDHAKAYCTALLRAVAGTKAAKKISGADDEQIATFKKDADKHCNQDFAPKKDLDVWIGGKYRLIQKIRINMEDSKDYIDIGQEYDNGDEVKFYVAYIGEDKSTVGTSVTLNVKTYATSYKVNAKSDDFTLTAHLDSKASTKDVKVTPPTNAVPFEEFMNTMNSVLPGGLSSSELSQLEAEAAAEEERINNAGILQ